MPIKDISEIDLEKECDNFAKSLVKFTVTMLHFFDAKEFFDVIGDKLYSYISCCEDFYKVNLLEMLNKLYVAEHHPEVFDMIAEKLEALEEQEENTVDYKEEGK